MAQGVAITMATEIWNLIFPPIKSSPRILQLHFLNCILDLQTKQESWCLVARFKGQASGDGVWGQS